MRSPTRRPAAWLLAIGLATLIAPRPAHGQVGLILGPNFVSLGDIQVGNVGETLGNRTGFHIGAVARVGRGRVAFRPGLLFVNSGALFEGASFLGGVNDDFHMNYLAFPFDVMVQPLGPVYVLGGPEFQLLLTGRAITDFDEDLHSWVAKAGFGAGARVGHLFAEIRYVAGLTGVTRDSFQVGGFTISAGDTGNDAIRLSVGASF